MNDTMYCSCTNNNNNTDDDTYDDDNENDTMNRRIRIRRWQQQQQLQLQLEALNKDSSSRFFLPKRNRRKRTRTTTTTTSRMVAVVMTSIMMIFFPSTTTIMLTVQFGHSFSFSSSSSSSSQLLVNPQQRRRRSEQQRQHQQRPRVVSYENYYYCSRFGGDNFRHQLSLSLSSSSSDNNNNINNSNNNNNNQNQRNRNGKQSIDNIVNKNAADRGGRIPSSSLSSSSNSTKDEQNTVVWNTTTASDSVQPSNEDGKYDSDVVVDDTTTPVLSDSGTMTTSTVKTTMTTQSTTVPSTSTTSSSSSSSSSSSAISPSAPVPSSSSSSPRQMKLMWCQSDRCVDVVRERVVGEHNSIILNGPATGQVAYRWNRKVAAATVSIPPNANTNNDHNDDVQPTTKPPIVSSILLLVKAGDEALLQIAATTVPKLTQVGIQVLLSPDLAAKLKHYYGVDDPNISLFVPPKDPNTERPFKSRHVDDTNFDTGWFNDMMYMEPFPDLVCTLGGDGLLMHASMLFQGPVPPMLAISGGSLGFLTAFSQNEIVDAVMIALGMVPTVLLDHNDQMYNGGPDSTSAPTKPTPSSSFNYGMMMDDDDSTLQVFPPNMPSYPYEPLRKVPQPRHMMNNNNNNYDGSLQSTAATTSTSASTLTSTTYSPKFTFGWGDYICMTIRMRLDCTIVNREGMVRARYNVLNEVVIDRGSSPYLAALECFCDNVHLTTVQADGVIFATYVLCKL
jgi:NAD kinase